jgi:hypothetical protein
MSSIETNDVIQDELVHIKSKKGKLNKATIESHLNFNVNIFKKWIKQKLLTDEKFCECKDVEVQNIPKLSGSHIALTSMNEELCKIILEKTIERLTKGKNGLYVISFNEIHDIIAVDPDLRKNLYAYLDMYDCTLSYKDQYCISEKCIKEYIDNVFNKSVDINNDAFNLLIYILLKTCVRIIDTAYVVIQAMKRKTIGAKIIVNCVSIHFSGTVHHLLQMKIDETIKLYGRYMKEKDKDDEVKKDNNDIEVKNVEEKHIDSEIDDDSSDEEEVKPKKKIVKDEPKKDVKKKEEKKEKKIVSKKSNVSKKK